MNASEPKRIDANQTPYRLEATTSWSQEMFSHTQQVVTGVPYDLTALDVFPDESPKFFGAMIAKPGSAVAEDQWWVDEAQQVAVIVDGVSSQLGAMASRQAVAALQTALAESAGLDAATYMQRMNEALLSENHRLMAKHTATPTEPEAKVMLASALVVQRVGEWLHYCHLGDCRLMLWRAGVLKNLTEDHSLLQEALTQGTMSADERWMLHSPLRHVLTRCLGEWQVDYPTGKVRLAQGDVLVLCSDGLTHTLLHSEISAILASFSEAPAVEMGIQVMPVMLNKVQSQGLSDDVSIIMISNLAGISPETRGS